VLVGSRLAPWQATAQPSAVERSSGVVTWRHNGVRKDQACAPRGERECSAAMSERASNKRVASETILALLAGLAVAGCEKKPEAAPEPPSKSVDATAVPSAVEAKEVPPAAPSGSAEPKKEKAGQCAPGGCAPGKCGANE
jgi:hypothetical protein